MSPPCLVFYFIVGLVVMENKIELPLELVLSIQEALNVIPNTQVNGDCKTYDLASELSREIQYKFSEVESINISKGDDLHHVGMNKRGVVIDASDLNAIKVRTISGEDCWALSECE